MSANSGEKDIAVLRGFISRKRRERAELLAGRLELARRDFDDIVAMIKERYRPERIYQWGSLVEGRGFSEISDIDIAIEGISDPAVFSRLLTDAEPMTDFPLHIVRIEYIHPAYAQAIRTEGRCIYER